MDSCAVHQTLDLFVAFTVFIANVDRQSQQHLTTEHLVTVNVCYVLEFGFYYLDRDRVWIEIGLMKRKGKN